MILIILIKTILDRLNTAFHYEIKSNFYLLIIVVRVNNEPLEWLFGKGNE